MKILSARAGAAAVAGWVALTALSGSAGAAAAKAGWTPGLDLVAEGAANVRGGAARGQTLHSLALAKIEWNQAENTGGGVRFQTYASVLSLAGRGPSERLAGDFLTASNIEGSAGTRLYAWWAEAGAGQWSFRVGALLADDEFCGTEAGGNLLNSAFGWPAFISADTVNTGPAFYVAAPGLRVERGFDGGGAWRFGLYDGDSFDSKSGDPHATRHGTSYRMGGNQGWFVISELAFAPGGGADRLKIGGWWHTAAFADLRDDFNGLQLADTGAAPRLHARNFGGYAAVEHLVADRAGGAGRLSVFARCGLAPVDRNRLSWALDAGLACRGLIPIRPADVTAIGFVHGRFSPRLSAKGPGRRSGFDGPGLRTGDRVLLQRRAFGADYRSARRPVHPPSRR